MSKLARPIGIALIALLVLFTFGRGVPVIVPILAVGALVYFLGKRAQNRGEGDGRPDGRP